MRKTGSNDGRRAIAKAVLLAGLVAGSLALMPGPAAANSGCPTVGQFVVTPPPSAGVDWSGCNLSSAYLGGANLSGANLAAANLARADLLFASLSAATLSDANLSGANLSEADLSGATVSGANLYGAFLDQARLAGANLTSVDLSFADLSGVSSGGITGTPSALPTGWTLENGYLIGPNADLSGADLSNADLSGVDLSNADLSEVSSGGITGTPSALPTGWALVNGYLIGPKADLDGANLAGANLAGTNLAGASLYGADLSGVDLSNADLSGVSSGGITRTPSALPTGWALVNGYLIGPKANLNGADLSGADLRGTTMAGADLTGANLNAANLQGASLAATSLSNALLVGATLIEADLTAADLTGATLDYANLTGAALGGANLTGADLSFATLSTAHLVGANLSGTCLCSANLNDADLTLADLSGAHIGATLLRTVLRGTNLSGADLASADMSHVLARGITGTPQSLPIGWKLENGYLIGPGADLSNAGLSNADLSGVDLSNADLSGVSSGGITGTPSALPTGWALVNGYLIGPKADLNGANLAGANLAGTNLAGAFLYGADLSGADLTGADLTGLATFGVNWTGATCPDGFAAEQHLQGSCVQPLLTDTAAPMDAPVVSGTSGNNNWYTSDVSVAWNWTDAGSGIDSSNCVGASALTAEGAAVVATSSCKDRAGNMASDSRRFMVDETPPTVTVTNVTGGASYVLGSVPAAGCSTTDGTSGVATAASVMVTTTGSNGVGSFTATCSGAADNAGNNARSVSVSYSVVYAFGGFFAPVDNPPVVNVAKGGQAIPVKFSLGGNLGLNVFAAGYPKSQQIACDSSSPLDDVEQTVTAGSSSLSYDVTTHQYMYVWKTDKAWAKTCRQLTLRLSDGSDRIAYFKFG